MTCVGVLSDIGHAFDRTCRCYMASYHYNLPNPRNSNS